MHRQQYIRGCEPRQAPAGPKIRLTFGKFAGFSIEEVAKLPGGMAYLGWVAFQTDPKPDGRRGITYRIQEAARQVYCRSRR